MPPVPVQCPRCRYEFEGDPKPGAFCPRCGEILKIIPGDRPVAISKAGVPGPSSAAWRPKVAAVLLGISTVLGLLLAMASLAIDDIAAGQADRASGDVDLQGRVTDAQLDPLGQVNITALGTNATATTDARGNWNLTVPAGTYRLLFEKPGYRSVEYRVHAIDYPIDLDLPVQMDRGSGTEQAELFSRSSRIGFAVFFALAALATLAATVSAARRTKWALAMIGAVLGILGGLPLLLGALCSLVAVVLLATSRREFRS